MTAHLHRLLQRSLGGEVHMRVSLGLPRVAVGVQPHLESPSCRVTGGITSDPAGCTRRHAGRDNTKQRQESSQVRHGQETLTLVRHGQETLTLVRHDQETP